MQKLNNDTVDRIERPTTILQFGSGNFLRAFVDWMVDQSNRAGLTDDGIAIAHATHRPDRKDPLTEQDGLYHVVLEGRRGGEQVRTIDLVTCVNEVVDPWEQSQRFHEIATSPELRVIVSNTTEAGICWREDSLESTPATSFPGQVAQVLHARFEAFGGASEAGLCIVACELIEDNGQTLRQLVIRHAEQAGWGPEFLSWLLTENHFYDTLVDRIVSGHPRDETEALWVETGYEDHALVKGELFSLWVIGGDSRLQELLPLDRLDLGVEFVAREEVAPFRSKKVRVLNSTHTAMAQLGPQLGFETVDAAFGDPRLRRFLSDMVAQEILPTIDEDPDRLRSFSDSILERFDNPALHHRLSDISLNSAAKWRSRNLPVVLDRWAEDNEAHRQVLSLAALIVLYSGLGGVEGFEPRDEDGIVQGIRDAHTADDLLGWVSKSLDVLGLDADAVGGPDSRHRLVAEVADDVALILQDGMAFAMEHVVA